MAAFKYTLTQTPTQILNGTKAAYVQEIRGKNTRLRPRQQPLQIHYLTQMLKERLSVVRPFSGQQVPIDVLF